MAHILSGLENLSKVDELLQGKRVGLMTHPNGVDHFGRSTIDIINEKYNLTALFGVEHGVRGDLQAGDDVGTYVDPATGVTVYSLFGHSEESKMMTEEMTEAFDVFVFDMQDVGVRFYTYMYSLAYAMKACAKAGKPMFVLDRLNPVGGVKREGTIHKAPFASFVGNYALPSRTGLTIGELALYFKEYLELDSLDLTVVPMVGWTRDMHLCDTDVIWPAPSPNCPTYNSSLCYVGTCVFEGTNLSEGRGTTTPFEVIGAPWVDQYELVKKLNSYQVPGVVYRATTFKPTFHKHVGEICKGVQMHVTDPKNAELFKAGLYILEAIRELYPDKLEFRGSENHYFIDLLLGTDEYRLGMSADELIAKHAPALAEFNEKIQKHLLY